MQKSFSVHFHGMVKRTFVLSHAHFRIDPSKCPNSAVAIYGEELQVENDEVFLISTL